MSASAILSIAPAATAVISVGATTDEATASSEFEAMLATETADDLASTSSSAMATAISAAPVMPRLDWLSLAAQPSNPPSVEILEEAEEVKPIASGDPMIPAPGEAVPPTVLASPTPTPPAALDVEPTTVEPNTDAASSHSPSSRPIDGLADLPLEPIAASLPLTRRTSTHLAAVTPPEPQHGTASLVSKSEASGDAVDIVPKLPLTAIDPQDWPPATDSEMLLVDTPPKSVARPDVADRMAVAPGAITANVAKADPSIDTPAGQAGNPSLADEALSSLHALPGAKDFRSAVVSQRPMPVTPRSMTEADIASVPHPVGGDAVLQTTPDGAPASSIVPRSVPERIRALPTSTDLGVLSATTTANIAPTSTAQLGVAPPISSDGIAVAILEARTDAATTTIPRISLAAPMPLNGEGVVLAAATAPAAPSLPYRISVGSPTSAGVEASALDGANSTTAPTAIPPIGIASSTSSNGGGVALPVSSQTAIPPSTPIIPSTPAATIVSGPVLSAASDAAPQAMRPPTDDSRTAQADPTISASARDGIAKVTPTFAAFEASPPIDLGVTTTSASEPSLTPGSQPGTSAAVAPTAGLDPASLSSLSRATIETTAHLATQISQRMAGRSTRFELGLTPEGLGRVDVTLDIDAEGQLSARLAFDNPLAATELRGRADELRRQLEDAGFTLARDALDFSSRDNPSGGCTDRRHQRASAYADRHAAQNDLADLPPAWLPPPSRQTPQGVDVKV